MHLSTDLTQLLTAALRSRADDVPTLADVSGLSPREVRDGVDELRRRGYLDVVDDVLSYRRPEVPVIDRTRATLAAALETLTHDMADLHTTLGGLPALLQAWDDGATEDRTLSADAVHGSNAAAEAWMHHFARDTPRRCDLSVPDFGRLLGTRQEPDLADWATEAMADLQVRVLISHADATDPDLRPSLHRMRERGTQIRWHAEPPSFFWVSDTTVTGLPFRWGDAWPTSVVTVRSTPVVDVTAAVFEHLWQDANPLDAGQRSWDPMLVLMNDGLTMEAAAAKLGMAHRTARRRVSDAMRHYGVESQFALGAAWARSRATRPST